MVNPIPPGARTVTPHLVIEGASDAIDFYKKAFGANELFRMPSPDGSKVMHAALTIGDSEVFVADAMPEMGSEGPKARGGTSVAIHLYVDDADAWAKRAEGAGATVTMPVSEMFWGDRYGRLEDPFGHVWAVATHVKDLTPEEVGAAAKAAFSSGQ